MKTTRITAFAIATALAGSLLATAQAGDAAAGQKVFTASGCAACHQAKLAPLAGKSEADLTTAVQGIVAGKVKHPKKLTLSADDAANVAAYIAANNK